MNVKLTTLLLLEIESYTGKYKTYSSQQDTKFELFALRSATIGN